MAELPVLPLWTEKWALDTKHLTRSERGLYMDWLIAMWNTPGCHVPVDLNWIARKLQCSPDEMPVLEALRDEFMTRTGNWLHQKRLTKEFHIASERRNKQRERAKARWDKDKDQCRGNANPSPSPSPSPHKDSLPSVGENGATVHQLFPPDPPEPWIPDEEVPTKPVKPPKKPKPGTRVPEDYQPTDKDFNEACMWLGEETVRWEHKKFKDHWRGAPGARGVKSNWDATWRNWMRRALDGRRDRQG